MVTTDVPPPETAEQTEELSYQELVERGREARKQGDSYQWTEGDLALQVEQLPEGRRPRDEKGVFLPWNGDSPLRRYAADIGVSFSSLKTWRTTAKAWPPERRRTGTVGWSIHRKLNALDDRFDLIHDGMAVPEANDILRKRFKGGSHGKPGWMELIGRVGDDLLGKPGFPGVRKSVEKAEADLTAFDEAVAGKQIRNKDLPQKAARYADLADEASERLKVLAERLRNLANVEI